MKKFPLPHRQRQTIIVGMLGFVMLLVIMQLWLLMATMNAFLAHDDSIVWPAAVASLVLFLLSLGLLFYLYGMEKE